MKLHAVSDLHLGHPANREAILSIRPRPDDWLILAGDVGETERHLELAFDVLQPRFRQLVWVPGNHELWSVASSGIPLRGEERYRAMVELCRRRGILTPEDPYPVVTIDDRLARIVPMFLLYDYSFRPADVSREMAIAWARETRVMCADEQFLSPHPYSSRDAWCHARCTETFARLEELNDGLPSVLINHWPLRRDIAVLPRVPRFELWCGTTRTTDWHRRFNAVAVIYGHLHIRKSRVIDGVRFEEVSLGYPKQWRSWIEPDEAVRRIRLG